MAFEHVAVEKGRRGVAVHILFRLAGSLRCTQLTENKSFLDVLGHKLGVLLAGVLKIIIRELFDAFFATTGSISERFKNTISALSLASIGHSQGNTRQTSSSLKGSCKRYLHPLQ